MPKESIDMLSVRSNFTKYSELKRAHINYNVEKQWSTKINGLREPAEKWSFSQDHFSEGSQEHNTTVLWDAP